MNINQVCERLQILLKVRLQNNISPIIVGISGGQGSGKSTLSSVLSKKLKIDKIPSAVLSLDDFYLTKDERKFNKNIQLQLDGCSRHSQHAFFFYSYITVPSFEKELTIGNRRSFGHQYRKLFYRRMVCWCLRKSGGLPETEWELKTILMEFEMDKKIKIL